jgi:hypothetical protein
LTCTRKKNKSVTSLWHHHKGQKGIFGKGVKLIGLDSVIDLVASICWSGQIIKERPLSLILVAEPGTGKTTILEKMESPVTYFFSDFTSREVITVLKKSPLMTHILLGDFLSVFGHQKSTVKLSVNLLSRLTGDTMRQMPWSGEEIPRKRMGFVTAIPPEDWDRREIKSHTRTGGFASRFLVARYTYSMKTKEKIHAYIRAAKYRNEQEIKLQIKSGEMIINMSPAMAQKIDALARDIKTDPVGFRAHFHMRTLAMSIARSRGSNDVQEQDYEKLLLYCEFFREQGKIL